MLFDKISAASGTTSLEHQSDSAPPRKKQPAISAGPRGAAESQRQSEVPVRSLAGGAVAAVLQEDAVAGRLGPNYTLMFEASCATCCTYFVK